MMIVIAVQFGTVIEKQFGHMACWTSNRGTNRGSLPTGLYPLRIQYMAPIHWHSLALYCYLSPFYTLYTLLFFFARLFFFSHILSYLAIVCCVLLFLFVSGFSTCLFILPSLSTHCCLMSIFSILSFPFPFSFGFSPVPCSFAFCPLSPLSPLPCSLLPSQWRLVCSALPP